MSQYLPVTILQQVVEDPHSMALGTVLLHYWPKSPLPIFNKVLALNVVRESQHNTVHSLSVCVTNSNPLMIVCHKEYYLSCASFNFLGTLGRWDICLPVI